MICPILLVECPCEELFENGSDFCCEDCMILIAATSLLKEEST